MYITVILCLLGATGARKIDDYHTIRSNLLEKELKIQTGGNLVLNEDETKANDIIMRYKQKEIDESLTYNQFNLSKHYFVFRNEIRKSKVYQIIRKMPKGALLHAHSSLMLNAESLVELTYEEHLYACMTDDDLMVQFSHDAPLRPCPHKWQLISDIRNSTDNATQFDIDLRKYFTIYTEDVKNMTHDINTAWTRFEKLCETIRKLISYRPVREKFFYKVLKGIYDDNIVYVEFRTGLAYLYELNGTVHDKTYLATLYHEVAEQFKRDYPDFIGVKLIITKQRRIDTDELKKVINVTRKIRNELPEFIAGFDLVAQEDLGKPLLEFYPVLDEVKRDMDFFFHSGETNWYGTASDENLIDAILLGAKRIGHGYALIKHPTLLQTVKEKDIAIEVNVISNLVLSLLCDVRNHPLASYIALDMPVVLASDDPGAWGADPLSHDFYLTFVAIASRHADLRLLKQLVINSVKYSALDKIEKDIMMRRLMDKWFEFIEDLVKSEMMS